MNSSAPTNEPETAAPEETTASPADDASAEADSAVDDSAVSENSPETDEIEDDGPEVDPAYADDRDDVEPLEFEVEEEEPPAEELDHKWYILKVQVNRETSICDALRRRVKINGMEPYFKEVLVPTEDVAEFNKSGKRRVVKKKLYPGYIMVNMVINDDSWFLVRETGGIGDFTGSAGKPTPMDPVDVDRILKTVVPDEDEEQPIKTTIPFNPGDRVRIKEGSFENFEGDVETIHEANGQVTVIINIFGRPNPVDLAHWQIEKI
ncbi:MAG TPA: transcription termination/antitermination factor NusG [Planctomycetaceae bacterium]|nr:transcription termination/antitermination factor NusG [Blastopirellula sp.]HAY82991.1 transcription termination/antitermination factor NusG [Planctomycetaceae bacterium]